MITRIQNRIHDRYKTHPSVNGWTCSCHQYDENPIREEKRAKLFDAATAMLEALEAIYYSSDRQYLSEDNVYDIEKILLDLA